MLSSKCAVIYSFILLITIINLVIEANSNSPESKAHSSLVYITTNQGNTMNQSYETFSHTNLNKIRNASSHLFSHIESTVNQTDLQTEMALLKRIRRRISLKNVCSHINNHQDAHKLVGRCARKKTSRRNPKFHVYDFNRKEDTKKESDMKRKKQDEKSSVLLNSKKVKNVTNTAPLKDYAKNPGNFMNNPYITRKRIKKVHGVNKTNLNNLSRNYKLSNKFGVQGKNSHPFAGRTFNSHESSMNQIYSKNKQRTNIHSSVKRISNVQKQKKKKEYKSFKSAEKKLNTLMGETEHTLKNDDSLKVNSNRDREDTGKATDEKKFAGESHDLLKLKENGLDDKKNLSESEKLEKASIPFHDQYSKDLKDSLLKTYKKSKGNDGKMDSGNETTSENSLQIVKVKRKSGHLRNNHAILQQVKVHDVLSRIRKHSHPKSLKRITRNDKNILYEVKDFIVNHFPKKRDKAVKSSQTHKNIHRETRNTNEDNFENTSRMSRSDIPGFKLKNENSKLLEEIKDFVVENFHIGRKKRNPLVQQNLIPHARSVRSSKDYKNYLSHTAIKSKNNAPEKIQSNSFMNAAEESDNLWGDLQGIVRRDTETNSISETVGNFTVSEYDDADDTNITEIFTDVHPQIMKKGINVNNSTFETTRQSEEENYKSDSDLVLDQYTENLSEITTNKASPTENEGTSTDFSSTEVTSDEISGTEENLESNTDGKNDSSDQDNVSESPDSSSLPSDDRIPEVTSKHLIEREISTVTNPLLVSSEEVQISLSSTFSEMSDRTFTSSPVTSTFSNSVSTIYENTTPLSTELSSIESKDITSVDSNIEWNSKSSLPSSTYTEGQDNSVETSSVLSTYSTSEVSSSVTDFDKVQTSLETRAPKVYRDVQHIKAVEDDYEDKTQSDMSTLDTFEEQDDTNTVGWLNRIQNISTLEGHGNKDNNKSKEYKYKLFTIAETAYDSMNKFNNIKVSRNYIRKHGGKSQMNQDKYNTERLASNMNKNTQKSRLNSVKDQKAENLSNAENENEYDEETVSEETRQVLKTTTESGKGKYVRFGNIKEGYTNLKAHKKMKSHALSNEPQKLVNSDFHSQHDYDSEDDSKSTIQDLINTERSKAFSNTKGKRVNSNIILRGNYQSLGIEFHTLTNLGPNTLDNTEEESSTTKNSNRTSISAKPAVQDKKEYNLGKIENSDENEYEFQTDSSLKISTVTFASNKVYRKPKEGKANLKSTQDVSESVYEALDFPPKLIVLHLRNETVKAEAVPTSLNAVSKDSWTSLPVQEIKNTKLNNQVVYDDEYEDSSDATSYISSTETLETTPKSRILKEYKNRLKKGEKLSNHGFEAYSKSIKLQMTTLSETQPFDSEMFLQTDKPSKEMAEDIEGKESDKFVNEAINDQKLEENWIRKPTISPNKKLKSSLKYAGLTLNIKKQGEDEQKEIESTRKETEHDQTFATYFVTLQNAKIMPDETTTSSTQSTYSDNPRAHESLSRLESINDLGEEYYDEVAHNSQNGERVSKHASNKEMKSLRDEAHVENGTVGQGRFDYDEDGKNDVEKSSYAHETIGYSTASDGLESSTSEETTMNDYELGVSEIESVTETPEHLQKNSVVKTSSKDKEFVRHLSSLISHLKQRRRNSQIESMNHRISRRARAVVTSKPTPKPELSKARMPPAKEWWIGGGGIIIMGLLIIGMYYTVIKISKKKSVWEKSSIENDFRAVHHYETGDEMEDRLSDDVVLLQSFIDQVMQKHEIFEDGSMKKEYSTAEHLSRIHAAITGTID